ncbi:hypothetical protein AA13594_1912 [Gluconacetobacter azotocaptans DSM 13594]|nr:hypothetical protein AA13594_1912 [Gluconacetobacter azotocaptans DSM 13594]
MTRFFLDFSDDLIDRMAERGHGAGKARHHPGKFAQDREKAASPAQQGGRHSHAGATAGDIPATPMQDRDKAAQAGHTHGRHGHGSGH